MAGPLDHDLDIGLPGPPGQLAEDDQFLDLGGIGGVVEAAGPQTVAEAQRDVEFAAQRKQPVVVGEERIFLIVFGHPLQQ